MHVQAVYSLWLAVGKKTAVYPIIHSFGSLESHLGKMPQALFKLSIAGLPFLLLGEYVCI